MERSIEASTIVGVAFARARQVLLDDPAVVFSELHTGRDSAVQTCRPELSVDLGAGASVHQEVTLEHGVPRPTDTGLVLPVTWHATGRERLLPTFRGELEVSDAGPGTCLRLTGIYTVPLGVVGRFGDGVLGRRLARGSLGALVTRLAGGLEAEVERRPDSVGRSRDPIPLAVQITEHPEIYVG
jgi:hypothetical protein